MLLYSLKKDIRNLLGWSSSRKIVVFESDDWGSIRMPSRKAFEDLSRKGIDLHSGDGLRYNKYDTLASPEDLTALYEVLSSVKDSQGKPAVFTALSVLANPDFVKIRESRFEHYFNEPFTKTLERYYGNTKSFDLWKEGIQNRLFVPEFHGREHLNVKAWMQGLKKEDPQTVMAFEYGLWGFNNHSATGGPSYQAAFDLITRNDITDQKDILETGIDQFKNMFGYPPSFFVAPNGILNRSLESVVAKKGIRFLFSARKQMEPLGDGKWKTHYRYLGLSNTHGQRYIIRNCFFEPNQKGKDWVGSCLNDIEHAFKWKKPAIVGPPRTNFIGVLDPTTRDRSFQKLSELLKGIVCRWPDVEFMTSTELGLLMEEPK